ncbi:MAG: DUF5658 family protein, partial [Nitrososphaera sp.]|nr:DUF5658 family protein [Nitrososphaera sp.]
NRAIYILMLILSSLDIGATHYGLSLTGWDFAYEANPFMREVMRDWGMPWAYIIRIGVPALFMPLWFYGAKEHRWISVATYFIVAVHFAVVGLHIATLYWLTYF